MVRATLLIPEKQDVGAFTLWGSFGALLFTAPDVRYLAIYGSFYPCTTGLLNTPTPSISTSTTSPAFIGLVEPGVPV